MNRIFLPCMALVACAGLAVTGGTRTQSAARRVPHEVHQPRAVLSTTKMKWGKDETLALWLSIYNGSNRPLRIDGRLHWPGNIFVWVKLPGSVQEIGAETVRPHISMITWRSLLTTVPPGASYGTRLAIGRGSKARLIKELKRLTPGTYTFRAVYYSALDPKRTGGVTFETSSNPLTIVVER